jgi:transcriptional regulator with XRE-family HTH domain
MSKKNPDERDVEVGQRVRAFRLQRGLSQEQLGDALGLTFQQVQKYEKGANRISASRLQHLCTILNVPVSFFFEGAPQANGTPDPVEDGEAAAMTDLLATPDGIALVTAYTRVRDLKVRRAIVALVEQITADPMAEPGSATH